MTEGFRRDQIYTRAKESEEDMNGIVRRGEIACAMIWFSTRM